MDELPLPGLLILRELEDGQKVHAEVVRKIDEVVQHDTAKMQNGEPFYFYQDIVEHEGPLTARSLNWKGFTQDVRVRWEDGSETNEPLNVMIAQDPMTLAAYVKKKGLLAELQERRAKNGLLGKQSSPLVDGGHPELDISNLLDDDKKSLYMTLVGALQWAVTLGRSDITYATMVMSRFCAEPRVGHMERVSHIYGYLRKYPDDIIHSVYGERGVCLFEGLPKPLLLWKGDMMVDKQQHE